MYMYFYCKCGLLMNTQELYLKFNGGIRVHLLFCNQVFIDQYARLAF